MILPDFILLVCILYAIFILGCLYYWNKIPQSNKISGSSQDVNVTVVVPVRNEAANMENLLKAMKDQDYPTAFLNICIVDDHSTDNTYELTERLISEMNLTNACCCSSAQSSKKNALNHGISKSTAELIITTDGDSLPGKEWVSSMVQEYKSKGSVLIAGPVKITGGNIFDKLQSAEFAGLIGIGAASFAAKKPIMCSGANLAFSRLVYMEVGGYMDSKSVSGDDTQLMFKVFDRHPDKISFLKDKRAIVVTKPGRPMEFFQQRRRWVSKVPATFSAFALGIAIGTWIVHASLLILFINSVYTNDLIGLLLPLAVKTIPEIFFLSKLGNFFNEKYPPILLIAAQPVYSFYVFIVGLLLPIGKFTWKGRTVK